MSKFARAVRALGEAVSRAVTAPLVLQAFLWIEK
jgi:hypothetical protein